MNIAKLKSIIQAANPEKEWEWEDDFSKWHVEPIRLADVLQAIRDTVYPGTQYLITDSGQFMEHGRYGKTLAYWNLKDDNLDHQSEETKQFLIDLLIQPS